MWDTVGSEYVSGFSTRVLLLFVCVDVLLQKHLKVRVYTHLFMYELTLFSSWWVAVTIHCLYSSSSIDSKLFGGFLDLCFFFFRFWFLGSLFLPAYYIVCISGSTWNLPVQSMMACSHQPVLLTIDFNPVVGGGSPQARTGEERTREDPEDRTRTKRGKHVGHCRQWICFGLFNKCCCCLFVLMFCCKSTWKWECIHTFLCMNLHCSLVDELQSPFIAYIARHRLTVNCLEAF